LAHAAYRYAELRDRGRGFQSAGPPDADCNAGNLFDRSSGEIVRTRPIHHSRPEVDASRCGRGAPAKRAAGQLAYAAMVSCNPDAEESHLEPGRPAFHRVRPRSRQAIRKSLWPATVRRTLNGLSAQGNAVGTQEKVLVRPANMPGI